MSMLESAIERRLKERLKEDVPEALCLKFVSPGNAGVPDRVILLPGGKTVFVELKAPKKRPGALQLYMQHRIGELGFVVFGCVDSVESVEQVVGFCLASVAMFRHRRRRKPEEVRC